ncbi:hypothetical protein ABIE59_003957, partial [Marinobacter sp. MBR-99]
RVATLRWVAALLRSGWQASRGMGGNLQRFTHSPFDSHAGYPITQHQKGSELNFKFKETIYEKKKSIITG